MGRGKDFFKRGWEEIEARSSRPPLLPRRFFDPLGPYGSHSIRTASKVVGSCCSKRALDSRKPGRRRGAWAEVDANKKRRSSVAA